MEISPFILSGSYQNIYPCCCLNRPSCTYSLVLWSCPNLLNKANFAYLSTQPLISRRKMALIQGSMPRRNLNAKVGLTLESRDSLLLKNFFWLCWISQKLLTCQVGNFKPFLTFLKIALDNKTSLCWLDTPALTSPYSRPALDVAEMSRRMPPASLLMKQHENMDAFSISLFHSNPLLFRNTTKYHFHCSWFKKILNCSGDWRQNYDVKGTVLQLW